VPPESPDSYYRTSERLVGEIPGAFMPGQYWNRENPRAHETTTGPEIWRQTAGRITHLVAGAGTGGTITGTARYLRSKRPDLVVVGGDTEGSVYSGDTPHAYLTEGVGEDFFPDTIDMSLIDRWVRVSDHVAFQAARTLTRIEGILAGESSGTALVAALTIFRELVESGTGAGTVIVVILPDTGRNYLSKLYNDDWMRAHGLLEAVESTPSAPQSIRSSKRGAA
jgi:cystathionine beta-synthase